MDVKPLSREPRRPVPSTRQVAADGSATERTDVEPPLLAALALQDVYVGVRRLDTPYTWRPPQNGRAAYLSECAAALRQADHLALAESSLKPVYASLAVRKDVVGAVRWPAELSVEQNPSAAILGLFLGARHALGEARMSDALDPHPQRLLELCRAPATVAAVDAASLLGPNVEHAPARLERLGEVLGGRDALLELLLSARQEDGWHLDLELAERLAQRFPAAFDDERRFRALRFLADWARALRMHGHPVRSSLTAPVDGELIRALFAVNAVHTYDSALFARITRGEPLSQQESDLLHRVATLAIGIAADNVAAPNGYRPEQVEDAEVVEALRTFLVERTTDPLDPTVHPHTHPASGLPNTGLIALSRESKTELTLSSAVAPRWQPPPTVLEQIERRHPGHTDLLKAEAAAASLAARLLKALAAKPSPPTQVLADFIARALEAWDEKLGPPAKARAAQMLLVLGFCSDFQRFEKAPPSPGPLAQLLGRGDLPAAVIARMVEACAVTQPTSDPTLQHLARYFGDRLAGRPPSTAQMDPWLRRGLEEATARGDAMSVWPVGLGHRRVTRLVLPWEGKPTEWAADPTGAAYVNGRTTYLFEPTRHGYLWGVPPEVYGHDNSTVESLDLGTVAAPLSLTADEKADLLRYMHGLHDVEHNPYATWVDGKKVFKHGNCRQWKLDVFPMHSLETSLNQVLGVRELPVPAHFKVLAVANHRVPVVYVASGTSAWFQMSAEGRVFEQPLLPLEEDLAETLHAYYARTDDGRLRAFDREGRQSD